MYRNNVNINDLINRFDVSNNNDFDMTENVKYVGPQYVRKYKKDENFGNDENRSIVKAFTNSNDDKFNTSAVFVRQSNVSMSGVKEFIKQLLLRISMLLEMISKFPFPRMSVMSFGLSSLLAVFIAPRSFTEKVLYPGFKILFTIIYPAYRSFKAVRNKNLKEYLKWLVFWIVYALFTCLELVTDALLNWFPFYYEIKVIFLIWILGPSSRGSMKVYKNIIHPILISREQEIDDIIQLAQDHGYMQVFKLSSKSVNYANKIIMQDAKTDSSFIVSHQLMKNISLSNLSDAGTIQSTNDNDNMLHMRRYSIENVPIYGNNQVNYSYENFETRRRPSFDYKYDDMTGLDYSSSTSSYQRYPIKHSQNHQKGAFIEENVRSDLSQKFTVPENNQIYERPSSRKASINELSSDEIILAYHKLQMEINVEKAAEAKEEINRNDNDVRGMDKSDKNYEEFLKWLEMKRNNEKHAIMATIKENLPAAMTSNQNLDEKVKTNNVNVCIDEKSLVDDDVNVSVFMDENSSSKDVTEISTCDVSAISEDVISSVNNENSVNECIENTETEMNIENGKTESDTEVDFDEFKDVISEDEEKDFLKVPLVIFEDNDEATNESCISNEDNPKTSSETTMIPTVIEENLSNDDEKIIKEDETTSSKPKIEDNNMVVDAKMTLTNEPLQIVTHLSTSSVSLASSDGNDGKMKRPAKHSKGRAPQPPAATTSNVIEGYFYDELTNKHFKETEL